MSESRLKIKRGKPVAVDGYTCQECGVWRPVGEVHTWLFCQLHKAGHDRETIIANVEFTVRALREGGSPQ